MTTFDDSHFFSNLNAYSKVLKFDEGLGNFLIFKKPFFHSNFQKLLEMRIFYNDPETSLAWRQARVQDDIIQGQVFQIPLLENTLLILYG